MIKFKEICKKLYQKIWFYKEYLIIFLIGLSTILWLMFSLGSTSYNLINKNIVKDNAFQDKAIEHQIQLPLAKTFHSAIINEEFDKKIFIEKYTTTFRSMNISKGKVSLKFSFFEHNYKIIAIEIIIQFKPKDKEDIITKKQFIRISKNNL